MQKFFVENSQINGQEVTIEGSDMNHIVNVLRMKKDDEIYWFMISDYMFILLNFIQ